MKESSKFVDDNFPMKVIDECINNFFHKLNMNNNIIIWTKKQAIKLFYEDQMNSHYKRDEQSIKDIVKRNVKTIDIICKLIVIINYCNTIVNNLIMVNNLPKIQIKYNLNVM